MPSKVVRRWQNYCKRIVRLARAEPGSSVLRARNTGETSARPSIRPRFFLYSFSILPLVLAWFPSPFVLAGSQRIWPIHGDVTRLTATEPERRSWLRARRTGESHWSVGGRAGPAPDPIGRGFWGRCRSGGRDRRRARAFRAGPARGARYWFPGRWRRS